MAEKQKRLREEKKKEEKCQKAEEAKRKKKQKPTPTGRKSRKKDVEGQKNLGNSGQLSSVGNSPDYDANMCRICFLDYILSDDENNPWIMCDGCSSWMQMSCVPFMIELECANSDAPFFCNDCTT